MSKPIVASHANQTGQAVFETSDQELNACKIQDLTFQHIETLKMLDGQHADLSKIEFLLEDGIEKLESEEKMLRIALDQSTASIKEQREREKIMKDEAAVARLEEALMGETSSESDDE